MQSEREYKYLSKRGERPRDLSGELENVEKLRDLEAERGIVGSWRMCRVFSMCICV